MEKQLSIVQMNLNLLNQKLTKQKNRIITECYKATKSNKEDKDIFIIFRARLKKFVHPAMLPFAYATLSKFVKTPNPEEQIYRSFENGNKAVNYILRKYEEKKKEEVIKESIKENRKEGKYFYVASKHFDSAKDHEMWQGKLYIDEKHPPELDDFVRENEIDTIQWVMGPPIYFITRQHCRHFFQVKSTKAILEGRYKIPTRKEGERDYQTPKGKMDAAKLKMLKERLALLKELYKIKKTAKLRDMILKTELLIKQYEAYISA